MAAPRGLASVELSGMQQNRLEIVGESQPRGLNSLIRCPSPEGTADAGAHGYARRGLSHKSDPPDASEGFSVG